MSIPYVVQSGDTWFRLAERTGLPIEELAEQNRWMHPGPKHYLVPGQVLFIPSARLTLTSVEDRERFLAAGTAPYGYAELMRHIQLLLVRYPFLQAEWIGRSVLGRSIPVLRLGIGPCEVHFNGSFHANEWITTPLLMRFTERLAAAVSGVSEGIGFWNERDARQMYERLSLWLVPMVNPDGVELVHGGIWPEHPYASSLLKANRGSLDFSGWKANIHGVDLNDQFPAGWEEERARRRLVAPCPGPRDYTGIAPLTEPEALAMAHFTKCRNFQMALAFHTQGEEIYWNYRGMEPGVSRSIGERLALASGYKLVKLAGSDAGYKDWFIQQFRRPGYTIEAGFGSNPLPVAQFGSMYERVEPLMLEACAAAANQLGTPI